MNRHPLRDQLILLVAEGFGLGRIPFAPGTFGTLGGFLWLYLLLVSGQLWVYLLGTILGIFVSVWIGSEAEKILGLKDPGRIVIDEIIAVPIAYLATFFIRGHTNATPDLSSSMWASFAVVFGLFRLFDIWKPWPVRQSQSLPGGWGLTIDDVLAALYVDLSLWVYGMVWDHFVVR